MRSEETSVTDESATTHCTGPFDSETARLRSADCFNIGQECFICGKLSRRGEKLIRITTGTREGTRQKVLNETLFRGDPVVQIRMLTHPDLFAFDGKYHRSRYAAYISKRNVSAAKRKSDESQPQSLEEPALNDIVLQIKRTVLSPQKNVTTLTQIKADYLQKLSQYKVDMVVFTWKLKEKLKNHFTDHLVFIERRGQFDVCSSLVTVGDALKKACQLQRNMESQDDLEELSSETPEVD